MFLFFLFLFRQAFARRESIKLFDQDKRNRQATSEKDLGVAKESVKIAPVMW